MAQQQTTTVVLAPTQPSVQTSVVIHKKEGNACRAAIPAMPMVMAVFCLLFNIFVPGFGTIIAGFTVFCCGNPGQSGLGKCGTMCLNVFVGLLQLVLTVILVGWIWSIMWGVAFIGMSHDYKQTRKTTTTLVTTRNPGPQALTVTQTTQPPPPQQAQAYYPQTQGYNQPHQQQGYSPMQPGYAPPPQQGYASPPQQGYAPPPQGYAPPPQQGYAPPLQGTAPPLESNSPPQSYPQQPAYNPYNQSSQQQPPPYTATELPPKKS